MIEIGLVDDHSIVREGLQILLNNMKDIHVAGTASTGSECLNMVKQKKLDLIILDFLLPDSNGLTIAKKLLQEHPTLKILVLTSVMNDFVLTHLLKIGVHGYLSKTNTRTELEKAVQLIYKGQRHLSPDIANRLALNKTIKGGATPFDTLSSREMQVLLLVAQGYEKKDIAQALSINTKTVNSYRYRTFEKLQVKNDIELVKLAIQYSIIKISTLI